MKISVVIPTFNRAALLRDTIPALANQRQGDFTYEVIFVSNGSSDKTDVVLEEAVARFPNVFRYYYIAPTGGPSAPRNRGIREGGGDVVIILDDDILPEEDLVFEHARFHREHPEEHHAALGEVFVPPHLLEDPMSRFHSFPYDEIRSLQRLSYLHFWTCNVSFKRRFMLQEGMFDENFLYFEDILCGHKLAQGGMHLHFLPSARGQHLHQLKPSHIPAKGLFTGRWLYALTERLPDPEIKKRFGVISRDLPAPLLVKRSLGRIFRETMDNPATFLALKLLRATNPRRSRFSDIYYFMIFMRNVRDGYSTARREARKGLGRPLGSAVSQWNDRGEK